MYRLPTPRGLLFDMDGTLTRPLLDFAAIKRDLGLRPDDAILEAMERMTPVDRRAAEATLDRHEHGAAERSTLNDGCLPLLDALRDARLPFAIVTRNSRAALEIVWQKHELPPCPTVTRDDAAFKPDPEPLRLAARLLELPAGSCWMIGDGEYDILAARAADMPSVWLSHGDAREFDAEPDATIQQLSELAPLLSIELPSAQSAV